MRAKHHTLLYWAAVMWLGLALLTATGCNLPSSNPPILVKQWTLEYQAPQPAQAKLPAELKVRRFQAAQTILGAEMIYRPGPNERGIYNYNRWLVSPSDLVGDFLLRDLRAQGALAGIFANRHPQRPRFRLEGGVEEFLEMDDGDVWHAALKVSLTLLDTKQNDVTKRLLFQHSYTYTTPMASKDPAGLAKGMSQNMARFSAKARADILKAIEQALKTPLPENSGG